ncbi:MAG: hypothetical protein M0018_09835 [Nitrospiraceae bacterium]|nr:hypothetical protein [Nitrospiraceae bacterium]
MHARPVLPLQAAIGYIYSMSFRSGAPKEDAQFRLPFEWDESALANKLALLTGGPVSLAITSNGVSVLHARRTPSGMKLRLHRIFLKAGPEVINEVARFARGRISGERFPVLSCYIKENAGLIEKERAGRTGRKSVLRQKGRFHDLSQIYQGINEEYFDGKIDCDITWGKKSGIRGARKQTLGCYMYPRNGARGLIRINPTLDSKNTPAFYIRFVVYHEMLHADLGEAKQGQRRIVHGAEFRRREKLFKEYGKAVARETR